MKSWPRGDGPSVFLAPPQQVTTVSSDSEPEGAPKKPLPKRRRYLTSSVSVPVYSTKVQNSLKLLKNSLKLPDEIKKRCSNNLPYSSEDEEEEEKPIPLKQLKNKPRMFDQSFKNLSMSLSAAKKSLQGFDEDDVALVDAFEPQELMLKVRCRADIYKICILMTEPLQRVVDRMSQILKVHPSRILLLHYDSELSVDATPAKLDLGVADIIDCIVETSKQQADDPGTLLLRVQGKDRSSVMEITIQKGEPLETLMNQYKEAQGLGRSKVVFYFDGQRLTETLTPEQLGMESGDVIEMWN
ncbi:NFATC2-interacting protein isoform X2 [Pseudonaja textilis]|uniref:NFATC2-interacting protein isoform X2 n=1 Tax=Pseudonaja textilis TaxID=8673 RepID=UPI000EA8F865|nr:NFATC2-interacting protein isoform X2 [Pseudonaja textilis]